MFVSLFVGLGASFSVLIVAENMVGVKEIGHRFYLQWAQRRLERLQYMPPLLVAGLSLFQPDKRALFMVPVGC